MLLTICGGGSTSTVGVQAMLDTVPFFCGSGPAALGAFMLGGSRPHPCGFGTCLNGMGGMAVAAAAAGAAAAAPVAGRRSQGLASSEPGGCRGATDAAFLWAAVNSP